jgi:hypothetical protein
MTSGPRRTKAPARDRGYGPEHVPALLERHWHDQRLAGLGYPGAPKSIRRAGSVLLVQWAAGGSMRDAAEYLGVRNRKAQYLFPDGLARWLGQHGTWALVTQGETRFAPRPIEASRPEPVRREWADRHSSTQWKLASSDRIHYAGLRKLLIEHASRLAGHIDQGNVPESPSG